MDSNFFLFKQAHRMCEHATHPLARPVKRLVLYPQEVGRIRKAAKAATTPLSLLLACPGRLRRRFAPVTRLNAPSGASNYGF